MNLYGVPNADCTGVKRPLSARIRLCSTTCVLLYVTSRTCSGARKYVACESRVDAGGRDADLSLYLSSDLSVGVLLSFLDVFLQSLLLRIVGILAQQFLPGLDGTARIALALPAHNPEVEKRSRMSRPILQRSLVLGDRAVRVSGIPERCAEVGEKVRVRGLALRGEFVVLHGVLILAPVVVEVSEPHQRVEIAGVGLQSLKQRGRRLVRHRLLLFGRQL